MVVKILLDDYSGYDDVEFCEYNQFMFDKEVDEWKNNQEDNQFPDDVEF